jgi:hypothetical protein
MIPRRPLKPPLPFSFSGLSSFVSFFFSFMFWAPPTESCQYFRQYNHPHEYIPRPYTLTSLDGAIFAALSFSF